MKNFGLIFFPITSSTFAGYDINDMLDDIQLTIENDLKKVAIEQVDSYDTHLPYPRSINGFVFIDRHKNSLKGYLAQSFNFGIMAWSYQNIRGGTIGAVSFSESGMDFMLSQRGQVARVSAVWTTWGRQLHFFCFGRRVAYPQFTHCVSRYWIIPIEQALAQ